MKILNIALALLLLAGTAQAADKAVPQLPPEAQPLVGTWDREENVPGTGLVNAEMTFVNDGTFHGRIQIQGRRFWKFAGKWQVKDGAILYDYTESDRKDIPVGTKDKDQIVKVTPSKLMIRSDTGDETYVRMDTKKEHDLYLGPR